MKRRGVFNPKRSMREDASTGACSSLMSLVSYGGNPEHKRNPGDFGLTPPSLPRADKTLCDGVGIVSRRHAVNLLREGIRRGLISTQTRGRFPQNIWAVTSDGAPLEAQLENAETGTYHGYPLPEHDPFRECVLARWSRS